MVNNNLSIKTEINSTYFGSYVNFTLSNKEFITNQIIQMPFPMENLLLFKLSSTYIAMAIILNEVFMGNLIDYSILTINDSLKITVEPLYREKVDWNSISVQSTDKIQYSSCGLIEQKYINFIYHNFNNNYNNYKPSLRNLVMDCPDRSFSLTTNNKITLSFSEADNEFNNRTMKFLSIDPSINIQNETALININDEYLMDTPFYFSFSFLGRYEIQYIIIDGLDNVTCSIIADVVEFSCPEIRFTGRTSTKYVIQFPELTSNFEKITLTTIPDDLQIKEGDNIIPQDQECSLSSSFSVVTNTTQKYYQLSYLVSSGNDSFKLNCDFEILVVDCPNKDITFSSGLTIYDDFPELIPYFETITFMNIPSDLTIQASWSTSVDQNLNFPLNTSFSVYSQNPSDYVLEYIAYSANNLFSTKCNFYFHVISISCPTNPSSFSYSVNYHQEINFDEISQYFDLIEFTTIPSEVRIQESSTDISLQQSFLISSTFSIISEQTPGQYEIQYTASSTNNSIIVTCSINVDIYSCYELCMNCQANSDETNHRCIECITDYEKNPNVENNCICSVGYRYNHICITDVQFMVLDEINKLATNCSDENKYLKEDQDSCSDDMIGYYYSNDTIETLHNYVRKCQSRCKTCFQGGDEKNQNCATCEDGKKLNRKNNCIIECTDKYFYSDSCIDECEEGLIVDETYHECINCKTDEHYEQYSYHNQCLTVQPTGSVVLLNDESNYYYDCYETCETCIWRGEEFQHNCLTCIPNYYLNYSIIPYDDPAFPGANCLEFCETHYYQNENNLQCENCQAYNKYKYLEVNECIDDIPSGYFIGEGLEQFHILRKCGDKCKECKGSPSAQNDNCYSCIDGLYANASNQPDTYNCIDYDCGEEKVLINTTCINCAESGKYKYKDRNECVDREEDTIIINPKYGIIEDCYEKCKTCDERGNYTDHKCKSCKEPYYLESSGNNCIEYCGILEFVDETTRECINCAKLNKVRYINSTECIDQPEGTYIVDSQRNSISDSEFGIIDNCSEVCKTCTEGPYNITEHNCDSCKNDQLLLVDKKCLRKCKDPNKFYYNDDCLNECPEHTTQNFTEKTCEDCPMYVLDHKCYNEMPKSTYIKYEIENGTTVLDHCYKLCEECLGEGNDFHHNCSECKNEYFLDWDSTNCIEDCNDLLVFDYVNGKCVNCLDEDGFKFNNTNVCTNIPDGKREINETYGAYVKCYATCSDCDEIGNLTDHLCTECAEGYYHAYDKPSNCIKNCSSELYQNEINHSCENCKDTGQFKFLIRPNCEVVQPNHTVVINENYNIIQECPQQCERCELKREDGKEEVICPKCGDGLYLLGKQCLPECPNIYGQDKELQECVNCKNKSIILTNETIYCDNQNYTCSTGYVFCDDGFFICNNTNLTCQNKSLNCDNFPIYKIKNESECSIKKINTFMVDDRYYLLDFCYPTCRTCDAKGNEKNHSCTSCANEYIQNYYSQFQCEPTCNGVKYYIDFENNYVYSCTSSIICPESKPYSVYNDNQCVESCFNESSCINCKKEDLYLDTFINTCVNDCPNGTYPDLRSHKCSFKGNDIPCQVNYYKTSVQVNMSFVENNVKEYIKYYLKETTRTVDIIKGPNYTIEIFNENQCQYNISYDHNFSFVDLEECEYYIRKEKLISFFAFAKIDMRNVTYNYTPNQVEYIAFTDHGRIDISPCNFTGKIKTSYPIIGNDINLLGRGKQYQELGIDIFNIYDPFFHDMCYPYWTNENKDVTLRDRRDFIYKFAYFCPSNCLFLGIDYDYYQSICECPFVPGVTLNLSNVKVPKSTTTRYKKERNHNVLFVKCFKINNLINEGSITISGIIVLQIILSIVYFAIGINKFRSCVLKKVNFVRPGNPPPTKINILFTQGKKIDIFSDKYLDYFHDLYLESKLSHDCFGIDSNATLTTFSSKKTEVEKILLKKRKILDDDILDVLPYQEGIKLDIRTYNEIWIHLLKEKLLFFSTFFLISEYESIPILFMYFLLKLSIIIFVNCLLFFEKYLRRRLLKLGKLGFSYILLYELDNCAITGIVSAMLLYAITLFFTTRKKIKYLKYKKKVKEDFLNEAADLINSYKRKNLISIIVCFILMIIILFYVTVFVQVYHKTFIVIIKNSVVSIFFCLLFQALICALVSFLRYSGKGWYIKFFYKLSEFLI